MDVVEQSQRIGQEEAQEVPPIDVTAELPANEPVAVERVNDSEQLEQPSDNSVEERPGPNVNDIALTDKVQVNKQEIIDAEAPPSPDTSIVVPEPQSRTDKDQPDSITSPEGPDQMLKEWTELRNVSNHLLTLVAEKRFKRTSATDKETSASKVQAKSTHTTAMYIDDTEQVDKELLKRYNATLLQFSQISQQLKTTISEGEAQCAKLKSECAKIQELERVQVKDFVKWRRMILLSAISSRTGKPISSKTIDAFEDLESKKMQEYAEIQFSNLQLQAAINRFEEQTRQRETLSGGLHMIDFEQLKIEKATLLTRIKDRSEESEKFKDKISKMVTSVSHVGEKGEWLNEKVAALEQELSIVDGEVKSVKHQIPALKAKRERLRKEHEVLKHKTELMNNVTLLKDFEKCTGRVKLLEKQLADLKFTHSEQATATKITKSVTSAYSFQQ